MPNHRLEELSAVNEKEWQVVDAKTRSVRRGANPSSDPFLDAVLKSGRLIVVDEKEVRSALRRGVAATAQLEMSALPGELYILMARHESGAITYHFPAQVERRSGSRGRVATTVRFAVQIPEDLPGTAARRGLTGKVVHAVVMKVLGKVVDKAMGVAGRVMEATAWKIKKLEEGWKLGTPQGFTSGSLSKIKIADVAGTAPGQRNLLFLHGTFSHASSAFAGLATARGAGGKTFFEMVQPIYGERIFAFDHFTVSRSPLDNAKALVDQLPSGPCLFDVVTHSRGGLVLRTLVETAQQVGSSGGRFVLGRAVLLASPNEGTPLASPSHFDKYVTWISNLVDMFPDNPFTIAAHFIAEALVWLARGVRVDLVGLAAMNSEGEVIHQLQAPPGPQPRAYSALVANYEPDQTLLQRMFDAGVDTFFGTANDLVVPSEGGWRVDSGPTSAIPGDQIGCFGRGGNLANPAEGQVTHTSFFSRTATSDFLARAFQGQPQGLPLIDPSTHLPFRGRRGVVLVAAGSGAAATTPVAPRSATQPVLRPASGSGAASAVLSLAAGPLPELALGKGGLLDEVFYLSVLGSDDEHSNATLLANFRNARVMEPMPTKGGPAGQRFRRMIQVQRGMRDYLDGKPGAPELPHGDTLVKLGIDLFETILPGQVRRLYDAARSFQPGGRLDLVFTSMISWLADLPWEFAYDTERKNFLATSEVNFTRNVSTTIPADRTPESTRLRILVVVAQPLGLAHLSVEEETEVIKSGFKRLIDHQLAEVEVLLDTTPALLHQKLEVARSYDVLHFIGHGEYNQQSRMGCLVFENEEGEVQTLDSQVLQQILCRRDIRLMFLNACESGQGGTADFNRGVAPALVAAGVPAVVANQFSVLDVSATAFAQHFYWALALGRTIGDAAREARVAVNYAISGEAIDWAVPVVFARNPADRLVTVKEDADAEVTKQQTTRLKTARAQRRSFRAEDVRRQTVGLWDVHRTIPHLDRIAAVLTEKQTEYLFKAVSITAPLGTWQREKEQDSEGSQVAYLNAEKVVARLREKPKELGLSRLIAITNFPLRDSKETGLYAWDDDPKKEISIFSTYELLEELTPQLTIERLVANAVAAFVSDLPAHRGGPKNCPSFYNADCEIQYVAGPLKLCAPCRRKLKEAKKIEIVEELLNAYP
jgi:CHAT domain